VLIAVLLIAVSSPHRARPSCAVALNILLVYDRNFQDN
jgi:hypothetical protein